MGGKIKLGGVHMFSHLFYEKYKTAEERSKAIKEMNESEARNEYARKRRNNKVPKTPN